jgi:hypothetical protein
MDTELCVVCNIAAIESEICKDCAVPPRLGVPIKQSAGTKNAIRLIAKTNRLMAGNATEDAITELYAVFADKGPKAVIIAPMVSNEDSELLCSFPGARRDRFFRSHCFFLSKNESLDQSTITSTQGHIVEIIRGDDGIQELFHLGARVPVVSHIQTTNGNHILRIKGLLYPYMKAVIIERDLLWSPWMYMLSFHECSNMVAAFVESGLYDEYTKDLMQPFTLFLPRNDTFTASHLDWLLNNVSPGELKVFVKRHMVDGYLQVDSRKHCQQLELNMKSVNQIETKSMDQLFITAKQVHQRIIPFVGIRDEGEVPTEAHCMEIYTLMRGLMVIIDSPLYDFESKRITASEM